MNPYRVAGLTVAALAAVAILIGCGKNNFRDVEGVGSRDPQKIEVYNNTDQHPNINRVCIDGVAFATTTREYAPILRVPEWDGWCKG
jgi:hypothetical protein